ncbi:MAG: hypothetical protein K9L22_11040 [Methylococcaceae bacterium]|nr:hypothetical protein [Methylococcaceae bacterium]
MTIYKFMVFPVTTIVMAMVSLTVQASLVTPLATTFSDQSITASIQGGTLLYGVSSIETKTDAMALSMGSDTQAYPAIHASLASAEVYILGDETALANINSAFRTFASAFSSEPLFSRAAAMSQSSVYAEVLPSLSVPSVLNLNWRFNALGLQAESSSSFAYLSDTINVVQAIATGIKEIQFGFYTFLENGQQTTGFFGDTSITQILENWFDHNMTQNGSQVALNANSDNLNIDLTLILEELLFLRIDHAHTEISYEAPPVAIHQVGDQVGYLAMSDDNNKLHWDAGLGLLSFDSLPINTLSNNFNQQYQDDPLTSAYLEIDPLQRLTDVDGRHYFMGNELRLVDGQGAILYKASLPSIVFDDALYADQGFNLFAPILNILELNAGTSDWLQDNYLNNLDFSSLLLPELFVGFNPLNNGENLWNKDFSAPASAVLSFSGVPSQVPAVVAEPSGLMLFSLGFVTLCLKRRFRVILMS